MKKIKIMNINHALIIIIGLVFWGCSPLIKSSEDKALLTCVNSEKFIKFYALCKMEKDTITIYNNLENFKNCLPVNIDCGKTLKFNKSNLDTNFGKMNLHREEKILLYKYEVSNKNYKLYFINTMTNAYLNFLLNKKYEIVDISSGAY